MYQNSILSVGKEWRRKIICGDTRDGKETNGDPTIPIVKSHFSLFCIDMINLCIINILWVFLFNLLELYFIPYCFTLLHPLSHTSYSFVARNYIFNISIFHTQFHPLSHTLHLIKLTIKHHFLKSCVQRNDWSNVWHKWYFLRLIYHNLYFVGYCIWIWW